MDYSLEAIAHLYHSKEFEILNQKFKRFNPLKVLQVDKYEIRHSNVLAWLLDPDENHQLGDFFVKKILSRLLTKPVNEDKVTTIDVLLHMYRSFWDTEIDREVKTSTNRSIDILLKIPSQNLVVVIENKLYAGESNDQLGDYLNYVKEEYKGYKIIPIFLSLKSDAPSHPDYLSLDYKDILKIITHHIDLRKDAISENICQFLRYYTDILQEELVEDEEAIELALNVYQMNQNAIDLLYISQHLDLHIKSRYLELSQQLKNLQVTEKNLLKQHYQKHKQTIDFIFNIGSNVIRQAFLDFVKIEEIPSEVHKAHVSLPNFILPDWIDYEAILGKPDPGYWLGYGLIIWFERTWDERLKINVEVGPIPFEVRFRLLSELESLGVSFQASGKLEGKKYTKIYTKTIRISDWANKKEVVEGMKNLYHDPDINETFKLIAMAIEKIEEGEEQEINETQKLQERRKEVFPVEPFEKFASHYGFDNSQFGLRTRNVSFLDSKFRELEKIYGKTRERWWWHNSTFTYWFERLKDDRLKLTLELGPLQPEQRINIIEKLEGLNYSFSNRSKLPTARFTRIFSDSKVVTNWEDVNEVSQAMIKLYEAPNNQKILEDIRNL